VADRLARSTLARAAIRLNRQVRSALPAILFLTDDERAAEPFAVAQTLPRGSLVIVRSARAARRIEIATGIAAVAKRRGLAWLVANDAELATRLGADGVHFAETRRADAYHWRACRPDWLITCAAHSLASCAQAARFGADAVLLAPVFATRSHAAGRTLGATKLRLMALQSPVPVYALGGIDARTSRRLAGARLVGLAVIGAWTD
jgi:thiamine-phosphate pyrophosphorylase